MLFAPLEPLRTDLFNSHLHRIKRRPKAGGCCGRLPAVAVLGPSPRPSHCTAESLPPRPLLPRRRFLLPFRTLWPLDRLLNVLKADEERGSRMRTLQYAVLTHHTEGYLGSTQRIQLK